MSLPFPMPPIPSLKDLHDYYPALRENHYPDQHGPVQNHTFEAIRTLPKVRDMVIFAYRTEKILQEIGVERMLTGLSPSRPQGDSN